MDITSFLMGKAVGGGGSGGGVPTISGTVEADTMNNNLYIQAPQGVDFRQYNRIMAITTDFTIAVEGEGVVAVGHDSEGDYSWFAYTNTPDEPTVFERRSAIIDYGTNAILVMDDMTGATFKGDYNYVVWRE